MFDRTADARYRTMAFAALEGLVETHGGVLTQPMLYKGFTLDGQKISFASPQGIHKPAVMSIPRGHRLDCPSKFRSTMQSTRAWGE